jgi:hypothetical protein
MEDGKDGWLFPQGDFDTCIDLLINIHDKPEKIHQAALQAQEKIHRHHQWSNNVTDLDGLFQLAKTT